jgi:hypothetical protein
MLDDKHLAYGGASQTSPAGDAADSAALDDGAQSSASGTPHHEAPGFALPHHSLELGSGPAIIGDAHAAPVNGHALDGQPLNAFGIAPNFGDLYALAAGPGPSDHQAPGSSPSDHHAPAPACDASVVSGGGDGLFWSYNAVSGLQLFAAAGHLVNGPGNGGFALDVLPSGAWELQFGGTDLKIGSGFHAAWMEHGPSAALNQLPGAPPAGNVDVTLDTPQTYDGSAGNENISGSSGRDIFVGGPNDYMNGEGGLNCAAYAGPDAVLIDLQHGHGYGGNAAGNSYVNMEQGRGSEAGSVLIGNSDGSDLKSGGADSVLISTGGTGPNAVGVTDELRPDGPNCLLVATVGTNNVVFDPTHGWQLGDAETMVGFNPASGDCLNLTAAVQNWVQGQSNIADYVKLVDASDGTHVMFDPTGHIATTGGTEVIDLALDHGLNVQQLYAHHNIAI